MNYRTYFKEWKSWKELEGQFDGLNGVYAFRLKSDFGRLKNKSSVLYIGKCDQKTSGPSGLYYRLKNYKQNNPGASERLKAVEREFGLANLEYSYIVCENPRKIEKELLDDYKRQHLELPPLNRSR